MRGKHDLDHEREFGVEREIGVRVEFLRVCA